MTADSSVIWTSTLHPDDSDQLGAMKSAAADARRAAMREAVVNCGRVLRQKDPAAIDQGLVAFFERPSAEADALFDDPAMQIWRRFLVRGLASDDRDNTLMHCREMPTVIERTVRRLNGEAGRYIPGTPIAFQQFDLDPYIMTITPPSYDFRAELEAGQDDGNGSNGGDGCNAALQADLVATALDSIAHAWPEMRREIDDFVSIIGYLPAADFRSCSAARYAGIVYLGDGDASLLDIEESLVHETGHQILYRVAEITPLTRPDTPPAPEYVLPWSGSKRDLFGYFHAFYIYALLVKYFWRRSLVGDRMAGTARRRAVLILIGIRLAEPVLKSAGQLTDQAQAMLAAVIADMDAVESAMAAEADRVRENAHAQEA